MDPSLVMQIMANATEPTDHFFTVARLDRIRTHIDYEAGVDSIRAMLLAEGLTEEQAFLLYQAAKLR
jgi:hypothetical protein